MSAFDGLPNTQFGDVVFPRESRVLHLVGRKHVHEYPHSPGGAPEKLGRGLYNITVRGLFHDRFKLYPGLFPAGLKTIQRYAEQQVTKTFIDPSAGSFPAFIVDLKRTAVAKVRSGETVDIEFLEDQQTAFLVDNIAQTFKTPLNSAVVDLQTALSEVEATLVFNHGDEDIFSAIQSTAGAIFAIRDTAQLYGNLLAAKVDQLTSLCQRAVDAIPGLQDPRAYPAVDALVELWYQATILWNDIQSRRVPLLSWTVPQTMPLMQVAIALYSDTTKSSDLLSLNGSVISDPLQVPAGTVLRYYPAQAA